MPTEHRSLARRTSTDPDVDELVRRADTARLRHSGVSMSFSSVARALSWYFPARERMSSPRSAAPRTYPTGRVGERVVVRVDGGSGGDIDDVLATLVSIGQALGQLKTWDDRMHHLVVRRHRDGWSMDRMAVEMKAGATKVSKLVHQGEMFLAGFLKGEAVLD